MLRRSAIAGQQAAWQLYMLRCGDGSLYLGTTTDLKRRLNEHAAGKGGAYTRSRLPVALVYRESYPDRASAQRREAALKGLTRREKLALLARRTPRATARAG